MRALNIDPVHDTRQTFRALVDAMARPGTIEAVPPSPADHAVLATLVDHEITLFTEDEQLREVLSDAGRYEPASFESADVIHVQGPTDGHIADADRGTLKEPSDGATAVYRIESLGKNPPQDDQSVPEDALTLCIAGPGVPGNRTFRVAGLPEREVSAISAASSQFPRGVEVILAAEGSVVALPRSVTVEVV